MSTSRYYEWLRRPPSRRDLTDAYLLDVIIDIHTATRQTYGVRRVHAEFVLGRSHQVGRRWAARLMSCLGLAGVHRRKWRHQRRSETVWPGHVERRFLADAPDRLWVTDITQHRSSEGWVYCAAVVDVFSRRVVGWSITDHLRTELVVDALEMARLRRRPAGTSLHSDRGSQYTSWLFGHRLREAGLLGSMGKVACAYANALMKSSWSSKQIELLDRRYWTTRTELAQAIFE